MDIKTYKKNEDYSYALGAFPTLELLKQHSNDVIQILIHSTFKNQEVIQVIEEKAQGKINYNSDKLINKLSSKENVFVIGIFKKYQNELNKFSNHLVLVNPSNMGNLGTIIRSALGFNFVDVAIILPGVDCFDPKVIRSSMGAIFNINIECFTSYNEYQVKYPKHHAYSFMLNAINQLPNMKFDKLYSSLVFGNEATGLDISFLDEYSIIIPHSNAIDSLNLPTAVGIALYSFSQQR